MVLKNTTKIITTIIGLTLLGLSSVSVSAVGESASLSSSGVNFEITPTSANPNGTVAIGTDNLTVSSTCSSGYKLYISTTSNDETETSLINTDNSEYSIPAVSGTISSPVLLNSASSKNHWGFAMSSNDTGIASTGFTDPTVSNISLFASVPTLDNMTVVRQVSSEDNTNLNVYYGVNASSDLTPGSYSNTVMYTMIMPSPCDYTLMFEDGVSEDDPVKSDVTKMPEMTTVGHGDTVNLGNYTSGFTREGYSITGWKNITDNLTYNKDENVNINLGNADVIKLAPVWTLNTYEITLSSGTGINSTTITVEKDTSTETGKTGATVTDTDPSIEVGFGSTLQISYAVGFGYHFLNWDITSVDTGADGKPLLTVDDLTLISGVDSGNNSVYAFTAPASNVSLAAKAEGNKYTVHFDGNGGSGEMSDVQMTYGVSSTLPENAFTLASTDYIEYSFYGWSKTKQNPSTSPERDYTDGQTGVFNLIPSNTSGSGETTLYAVWKVVYSQATMQGWTGCTSLTVSTTSNYNDANTYADLLDVRNNVTYRVRRYSDDNCWMSQNLALTPGPDTPTASVTSGALTTSTSDSQGLGTITYTDTFSTSSYSELQAIYDVSNASSTTDTTYFSWNAALIACPAGWTLPTQTEWSSFLSSEGIIDGSTGSSRIQGTPYDFAYTGFHYEVWLYGVPTGYYWSATASNDLNAHSLFFSSSEVIASTNFYRRYNGFPIRCIQANSTTMQSFTSAQCAELTASTTDNYEDKSNYRILRDTRNSVYYTIRKYADEKCWMAQNLAITPGSTPPTSNVTSGTLTTTTSDSQAAGSVSFVSTFSTSSYSASQARYDTSNSSPSKKSGYYSWTAANMVCPAGWTLPTQTEWSNFLSSENLANDSDGSSKAQGTPYNLIYMGRYTGSSLVNGVSGGYYWSSTASSSNANNAYLLLLSSSGIRATNESAKYGGFAVRCLRS